MGIAKDGEITGGVIFSNFEGADVQVTVFGNGWTNHFLNEIGRYVYDTLGCERMTFLTEQDGVAAYAKRLGCKPEGLLRSHYGKDRDAYVMGALRSEWKYRKTMT